MAFSFDSDPSSPGFNCYVSVEDATDYFTAKWGADKWTAQEDGFTPAQQQALLVSATRALDVLRFGGQKASSTQPLQWPRSYIEDWDGNQVPSDSIPANLKSATCEMAYWIWTEDDRWFSDTDLGQIKSYQVPAVNVTALGSPERFPNAVSALLDGIGPGAAVTPSNGRARGGRITL